MLWGVTFIQNCPSGMNILYFPRSHLPNIYQKGPKTAKILNNGQNSNSKTVLESVLVTDSKNGFRFKLFSQEVAFSEYQK